VVTVTEGKERWHGELNLNRHKECRSQITYVKENKENVITVEVKEQPEDVLYICVGAQSVCPREGKKDYIGTKGNREELEVATMARRQIGRGW